MRNNEKTGKLGNFEKEREDWLKQKKELDDWNWPKLRVNFGGAIEYMCPHGIGHGGIHGCDGCCYSKSYEKRLKQEDDK